MNEFLPSRFVEVIHRLAVGIEPLDAQGAGRRLPYQIQARYDGIQFERPHPPIEQHDSNLFSIRYQKGVRTPIDLRFFDLFSGPYKEREDRRRVVPRRLRIPVLTQTAVEAAEQPEAKKDFRRRLRRPVFFPGAAYNFPSTATGLRGRVTRGGEPMRWARVNATLAGQTVIAGRAHGDDRGEFLLLLNSNLTTGSALPKPLEIEVSVFGPAVPPVIDDDDPLLDLPLETLSAPGAVDDVARGVQLPAGYTASVTRVVQFTLGKCLSGEPDFQIT
jgi:hypothetical protein